MALAYHGNYCGPGWSAGQYQSSVESDLEALDVFDETCKEHDAQYARPGTDLARADLRFAAQNLTVLDPKRNLAGALVGAQGLLRTVGILGRDNVTPTLSTQQSNTPTVQGADEYIKKDEMTGRKNKMLKAISRRGKLGEVLLRKTAVRVEPDMTDAQLDAFVAMRRGKRNAVAPGPLLRRQVAPAAVATEIKSTPAATRTTRNGCIVSGTDLVGTVANSTSANWQIGALVPLHPAYYVGSVLANACRSYAKYRVKKVGFTFVTKMPTSTAGDVVLSFRNTSADPVANATGDGAFLTKALSRGGSVIGAVWSNHSCVPHVDSDWHLVNAFITDWADNVAGELEVYVQTNNTTYADVGYIMMTYEIEFTELQLTPHSASIPFASNWRRGPQSLITIPAATQVPGGPIKATSDALTPSDTGRGMIWRVVIDKDLSTLAANLALGIAMPAIGETAGAATLDLSLRDSIVLTDGMVLYAAITETGSDDKIVLYANYDAALAGGIGGLIVCNASTTTATASVLYGAAYVVRLPAKDAFTA